MITNSPPHHRHLWAPACQVAQTAAPQALPVPSAITAQAPIPVHVSDMASPARATESSSIAAVLAVVIVTMTLVVHLTKKITCLPTPDATAWSFVDERSIIIKGGRGESERRERRHKAVHSFRLLKHVSYIQIARPGWLPGTLYEPEFNGIVVMLLP